MRSLAWCQARRANYNRMEMTTHHCRQLNATFCKVFTINVFQARGEDVFGQQRHLMQINHPEEEKYFYY